MVPANKDSKLTVLGSDMEKVVICGKFRALKCPQNSMIRNKGWTETCESNVGVAW